jgi:hypothetical protein
LIAPCVAVHTRFSDSVCVLIAWALIANVGGVIKEDIWWSIAHFLQNIKD